MVLQLLKEANTGPTGNVTAQLLVQLEGKLPPQPQLVDAYLHWQATYRGLKGGAHPEESSSWRLEPADIPIQYVSRQEDCLKAAKSLQERFNQWLLADTFRGIREKLLEKLSTSEPVRLVLQTEDLQLQRLPWHLWDLLKYYPHAEVAFSAASYEQVVRDYPVGGTAVPYPAGGTAIHCASLVTPDSTALSRAQPNTVGIKTGIRILAILGNSTGLDVQADQALLQQLSGAEVTVLAEPSRQQMSDHLWEQSWDILFFAGHSLTQNEAGRIYLNATDNLTLSELSFALGRSIERGLKLAIFNSCDGLGLARELADLRMPQMIVMREPVPDRVAQAFLRYFIQSFAQGQPFYVAVREARERLQSLEKEFPCASWLPQIYQNPAEVPVTWQALQRTVAGNLPTREPSPRLTWKRLRDTAIIGLSCFCFVGGIRALGVMESLELQAFDQMVRSRPDEGPDPRLLVVTIDEAEIKAMPLSRSSISDAKLEQLLQQLQQHQPRLIALDLYRDFAVDQQATFLKSQYQRNPNLIGTCKGSDRAVNVEGIPPPSGMPLADRVGFSDFLEDHDGVLRRHVLTMHPAPDSPCQVKYAFSTLIALRYLQQQGIEADFISDPQQDLKLKETVFRSLDTRAGGYQNLDARGQQILINYRSAHNPVEQVSLTKVLAGAVNPDSIKNRIVLVGVISETMTDLWLTPYRTGLSVRVPGVLIQAQMVSQILSTVLDRRPLLWVLPLWGELVWLGIWCMSGVALAWTAQIAAKANPIKSPIYVGLGLLIGSIALYLLCYTLLLQGGWVPLVPAVLAIVVSAWGVKFYLTTQTHPA